jgi:hypothetical protein
MANLLTEPTAGGRKLNPRELPERCVKDVRDGRSLLQTLPEFSSHAASLCRYLHARGENVLEVSRISRGERRLRGKDDSLDAARTAWAALSSETLAQLIVAWSHHGRLRSEACFARLAGVAPVPASSGQTHRHRLSRGGDRQLNRALHTIALHRRPSRCRNPRLHRRPRRRRSRGDIPTHSRGQR